MIVEQMEMITLLGGGECSPEDLQQALTIAPFLVAADGGADHALAAGVRPDVVIGDLDSISAAARAQLAPEAVHHITEQDSTDFDKCLRSVRAPVILALGFLGARMDHQLAVLNGLVRHAGQPCVLLGDRDVVFACPPALTLSLPVGTRFSLFPMAPVQGASTGLRWPIGDIKFAPSGMIGTSNEVAADPLTLTFEAPGMIAIVPRSCLMNVLAAFSGGSALSP